MLCRARATAEEFDPGPFSLLNEAAKATGSAYAAPQLAYKAVIELAAQNLTLPNGEGLKLSPGMAATIEIHQGRRTVMEYLLSPVQRVTSEAGRER